MLTKTSLQTIKALVELSRLEWGKSEGAARVAERIQAQPNYLGKVLQGLTKHGLVISQKGLRGGFRLAKPARQISLFEVVNALEDLGQWEGCFMGNAKCSSATACPAHKRWDIVRRAHMDFLNNTNIEDLQ